MKYLASSLLLLSFSAFAQQPVPPATTTLKAEARLVVVDVVVAGRDHVPVHGLKDSDFIVTDKGVPQKLRFFEEHTRPAANALPAPAPRMPLGTYTNYAAAPVDSTLNILLLDTLNTPVSDQNYYIGRVREFLKKLRPGSAVAIFSLGGQLRMLQGFTTDTDALLTALDKPRNRSSLLLDSPADGVQRTEGLDSLIEMEADAGQLTDNLVSLAEAAKALELKTRVLLTVDELSTLARYLSGISGRKNMVWATGGFSLSISPNSSAGTNAFEQVVSFESEFRKAIKLLAQSQTAVYTIEPQGLAAPPSGDVRNEFSSAAAANQADLAAFVASADVHGMMNMISDDTGGRAFYQTNAVGEATAQALEEGSTYYTLAFVPAADSHKQEFHKLTVKLAREGFELRYRRGYYPESPPPADTVTAGAVSAEVSMLRLRGAAMTAAMGHGLPGTTQILYKVRVLPATTSTEEVLAHANVPTKTGAAAIKPPYRRLLVDFSANPRDLTFERQEDGTYTARIRFATLLYLPDGRISNRVSNTIDTKLTPAGYVALRSTGFNYRQEISIPAKGDYSLRTGVQDMNSGRIGSVECDASAIRRLPPLPMDAK